MQDIQEQQSYRAVEAGDDVRVIEDLGFSSLDIAQLVAQMEMETGVDPFSQGETISSITTVGSICDIYQKYMDSAQS
ncbi:acyl carrier protein [Bacillus amyloliquefaciens LFB112]|nr:acyl carrier protein [Bacillus amyloliquefaciens LFB112]